MIKIHKLVTPEQSSRHDCATIADAHELFDADHKVVIARCETDEECLGLISAVLQKSKAAAEKGIFDTVHIWAPSAQLTDGDGWRLIFEQQEALTLQGQKKQQAAQQAQAQQMMAAMRGPGFQHPANGQRGVRR